MKRLSHFAPFPALVALARVASAQAPAEPPELGPPPPPPPGAHAVLEPDAPLPPPKPVPVPSDARPARGPSLETDEEEEDVPSSITPAPPVDGGVAPAEPQSEWYGWKLLIADGATLSIAFAEEPVRLFGQAGYVLAGPAIHLGHKQGLAALGSLALRLGVPLALNSIIDAKCGELEPCFPAGWFVGALAASAIDDLALARRTTEAPKTALSVAPSVAPTRGGALVSVGGTF